jgi:hypothetical protein
MICQKCQEEGLKSRVQDLGGTSTLLGYSSYYDEDGKRHSHDPNTLTNYYKCSNGHEFYVTSKSRCSNCNYGAGSEKLTFINETTTN